MNTKENYLIRQAYLDDQLSLGDIARYEQELSQQEAAELDEERHFESSLTEFLKKDTDCPEEFWQQLKSTLQSQSDSTFGLAFLNWPNL